MSETVSRRAFLEKSGKAVFGLGIGLSIAAESARAYAANDKIVVGIIACGGMGRANLNFFKQNPDVEIAAVCDVYEPHMNEALKMTEGKAAPYKDYRRILDRKDIDAVVISTPDHWHALQTIHACEAGKDVYVEKPLSLTIAEGRKMVEAARRHKRVVQVGTQQRAGWHYRLAVEIVSSGMLGTISLVRAWNVGNSAPGGIGKPPDSEPPKELDWDLWLGPAPMRPYNVNRFRNFRWFWDYSGGQLTDWGTHHFDIIHWAMGVDAPLAVSASGGRYVLDDNGETPDTLEVIYDYPPCSVAPKGFTTIYSSHMANAQLLHGRGYGIAFYGSNGTLILDRGGFEILPERAGDRDRMDPLRSGGSPQNEPHVREFLDCIKSRQRPTSDIEVGHRSTSAPHLGNIALWTGHKIRWDAKNERVIGDKEANEKLSRAYRKPWRV